MNRTSASLLYLLVGGKRETAELAGLLGIGRRQLSRALGALAAEGYVERRGGSVALGGSPKAVLLRDVARVADVRVLLRGPNEAVLAAIGKGITTGQLAKKLGLSMATVRRAVSSLRSIGAIQKVGETITVDPEKKHLVMFAEMLWVGRENRYEGDGPEVIYKSPSMTLRRSLRGGGAKGVATGFSMFTDYGMMYDPAYSYFCEKKDVPDINDILLHAVYAAAHSKNKTQLAIAMVFYLKHRDDVSVRKMRKGAAELGILGVWLDVETYVRRAGVNDASMFLPWAEFADKAELYDIQIEAYPIQGAAGSLFKEIGRRLPSAETMYVFGGENMRIKSLKDRTKDCDAVVEDRDGFDSVTAALSDAGYVRAPIHSPSDPDTAVPSGVFVHPQKIRVDLFTSAIVHGMRLSPAMKSKADMERHGNLVVGLLRNEDVFLLKAVAGREGDLQDMKLLVGGNAEASTVTARSAFDWWAVWDEIRGQENAYHREDLTVDVLDSLSHFSEQYKITIPFLGRLKRHVVDGLIRGLLRGGGMPVVEIAGLLEGGDVSAQLVRRRVDALAKSGTVQKISVGRAAHARLAAYGEYPWGKQKLDTDSLIRYLTWRFHTRQAPTDAEAGRLAAELAGGGLATAGDVDAAVRGHIDAMREREDARPSEPRLDAAGAARACLELGRGRARASRRG